MISKEVVDTVIEKHKLKPYVPGTPLSMIMTQVVSELYRKDMSMPRIAETLGIDEKSAIIFLGRDASSKLFDENNKHWTSNKAANELIIRTQETWLNDTLHHQKVVLLNDAYVALGFQRTKYGASAGWYLPEGHEHDQIIRFRLIPHNDLNMFWIEFKNIEGDVLDHLPLF